MSTFDSFQFMKDLESRKVMTQEDYENFNLYRFQDVLSMVKGKEMIAAAVNTPQFFALPKELQVKAFTALSGTRLPFKWKKGKSSDKDNRSTLIERVMRLFDCGYSDAVNYVNNELMTKDQINDLYMMRYEPDKWLKQQDIKGEDA